MIDFPCDLDYNENRFLKVRDSLWAEAEAAEAAPVAFPVGEAVDFQAVAHVLHPDVGAEWEDPLEEEAVRWDPWVRAGCPEGRYLPDDR